MDCALYRTQVKRGPDEHQEASWRFTDTRARELRVAQLAGKSDSVLKFVLSITLSMPVRSTYLLPMPGGCGRGFIARSDRPGPAKSPICRCKMTSPLVQVKHKTNFKIVRRLLHITDLSTFVPLFTFLSLPLVLQPRFLLSESLISPTSHKSRCLADRVQCRVRTNRAMPHPSMMAQRSRRCCSQQTLGISV